MTLLVRRYLKMSNSHSQDTQQRGARSVNSISLDDDGEGVPTDDHQHHQCGSEEPDSGAAGLQ